MNNQNKYTKLFFDFFRGYDFLKIKSFPLKSNKHDTLFTIAGIMPFRNYFKNTNQASVNKIITSQKCIRTNDIDLIGKTKRHLTGFTMLGHFQFKDVNKEETLERSYRLVTEVYGISKDKLIITCHPDDKETQEIWKRFFDENQIILTPDNIWKTNTNDLSGYCTEFYYNFQPEKEIDLDSDNLLEFYNIVFIDKSYDRPLPCIGVDSGLGLERLTYILSSKNNVYEVLGDRDPVIEDHLRTCKWIISEGIKPSNTKHGYVLRRLLRRLMQNHENIKDDKFINSRIYQDEYNRYRRSIILGEKKLKELNNPTYQDLLNLFQTYGIPIELSQDLILSIQKTDQSLQVLTDEANHIKKKYKINGGCEMPIMDEEYIIFKYFSQSELLDEGLSEYLIRKIVKNIPCDRIKVWHGRTVKIYESPDIVKSIQSLFKGNLKDKTKATLVSFLNSLDNKAARENDEF